MEDYKSSASQRWSDHDDRTCEEPPSRSDCDSWRRPVDIQSQSPSSWRRPQEAPSPPGHPSPGGDVPATPDKGVERKRKQRRPEVQVYVPRGRRAQTTTSETPNPPVRSEPSPSLQSPTRPHQNPSTNTESAEKPRKVRVGAQPYVPRHRRQLAEESVKKENGYSEPSENDRKKKSPKKKAKSEIFEDTVTDVVSLQKTVDTVVQEKVSDANIVKVAPIYQPQNAQNPDTVEADSEMIVESVECTSADSVNTNTEKTSVSEEPMDSTANLETEENSETMALKRRTPDTEVEVPTNLCSRKRQRSSENLNDEFLGAESIEKDSRVKAVISQVEVPLDMEEQSINDMASDKGTIEKESKQDVTNVGLDSEMTSGQDESGCASCKDKNYFDLNTAKDDTTSSQNYVSGATDQGTECDGEDNLRNAENAIHENEVDPGPRDEVNDTPGDKVDDKATDEIDAGVRSQVDVAAGDEVEINAKDEVGNETRDKVDTGSRNEDEIVPGNENDRGSGDEDDEDGDTWDALFTDDGDCLDSDMMNELTKAVGKVKVCKPAQNYLSFTPKEPNVDYSNLGHLVEIADFPKEFLTRDIISVFKDFMSRGFDVKWVDDNHAIGIFSSESVAREALEMRHAMLTVRPIAEASRQTRMKVKKSSEFVQPYKPRPETSLSAARRLVSGALGLGVKVSREDRDKERRQLREAKDRKKKAAADREAAWNGTPD